MCLVNNWHSSRCVCVCAAFCSRHQDDDSGGYASAASAVGRSGVPNIPGAEDMMSEMTRRLRERRAKAENNTQVSALALSRCPAISLVVYSLCGWRIHLYHYHSIQQHTHTHPFNGPLSRTTQVSRYQKGKTSLDFTDARDIEFQWHHLGKSAFSADR